MPNKRFIHLHLHSQYSLLDGVNECLALIALKVCPRRHRGKIYEICKKRGPKTIMKET